jgi:hypothetical protein
MTTVRSLSSSAAPLRCVHCGRPVKETFHTRSSYQVDYYSLHTGDVEPLVVRVDEDEPPVTFQRLVNAVEVVTCANCYRDPAVQQERERRFRPELAGGGRS